MLLKPELGLPQTVRLSDGLGRTFSWPCSVAGREYRTPEQVVRESCRTVRSAIHEQVFQKSEIFFAENSDEDFKTRKPCGRKGNDLFNFSSVGMVVIPVGGWRFAPACCAAQSVSRRGPGCAVPHHRLPWAALNSNHRYELHPRLASIAPMKKAQRCAQSFSSAAKTIPVRPLKKHLLSV